jgi:hypothetical protein
VAFAIGAGLLAQLELVEAVVEEGEAVEMVLAVVVTVLLLALLRFLVQMIGPVQCNQSSLSFLLTFFLSVIPMEILMLAI